MLKRIFNLYENATNRRLRAVCEKYGTSVYAKVRLADIFRTEGSGITDRDHRFCLQSHVDFLIVDREGEPLLGVEFDGPRHQTDPKQKERDTTKDRLCERFELPLLRIGHNHVIKREGTAFVEYMVELHFCEKAVQEAIDRGDLGPDAEYFPGTEFDGTTKLRKRLHKRGILPFVYAIVVPDSTAENLVWYRVRDLSSRGGWPATGPRKATVTVEVLRGGIKKQETVFSVKRTTILEECSPNQDVLGVHGWHIATQFATFLCFQEVWAQVQSLPSKPRG